MAKKAAAAEAETETEKKPKAPSRRKAKSDAAAASAATAAPKAAAQYEAMFLFPPPGVVDVEGMQTRARGMIEAHGGKILFAKKWDERKLSYEIKHQKRGTYIIVFYEGPGASVASIERDVNLSEDVVRVLITRADHLNQTEMEAVEPQPIQPREERPVWDRPDFNRPQRRDDRGPRRDEGAPEEAGVGAEKD
jgi:small subunit ribosomal protein S6